MQTFWEFIKACFAWCVISVVIGCIINLLNPFRSADKVGEDILTIFLIPFLGAICMLIYVIGCSDNPSTSKEVKKQTEKKIEKKEQPKAKHSAKLENIKGYKIIYPA